MNNMKLCTRKWEYNTMMYAKQNIFLSLKVIKTEKLKISIYF